MHTKLNHIKTAVAAAILATVILPHAAEAKKPKYQQDYCRNYVHEVIERGHSRILYGTACRQWSGKWRVVAEGPSLIQPEGAVIVNDMRYYAPDFVYTERGAAIQPVWIYDGQPDYRNFYGRYGNGERRRERDWYRHHFDRLNGNN